MGCVGDDGHGEPLLLDLIDCEADPINGNGPFVDQVSRDLRGGASKVTSVPGHTPVSNVLPGMDNRQKRIGIAYCLYHPAQQLPRGNNSCILLKPINTGCFNYLIHIRYCQSFLEVKEVGTEGGVV